MTPENPAKRRRGGQPGNQNAIRNRGGHGAPIGNQYARKHHSSVQELLQDYPEYSDWIKANAEIIDALIPSQKNSDRALYSSYIGLTTDRLEENRQEHRIRQRNNLSRYIPSTESL
jgi:hypothetical protein